jgi:chorismate mutase/prephenate dehydratase
MDNRYRYKMNPVLEKLNPGCREKNEVKVVCYQGLECSYSESAAKSMFGGAKLINRLTFEDVFKSVFEETADIGIVPIENSTAGYINDVYDLLLKYDLFINHTYEKKVDHCLASSSEADIEDIREVYSHPQALAQCSEYITRNKLVACNEINTAVAAQKTAALNKKNAACICSEEAAMLYGLKIIEKQINDQKKNYTRFAAVSKKLLVEDNHNKVSIVFNVLHETGSLSEVLSTFAYYGCNLSYINSRPNRISTWEYMFYVDFEGNLCDKKIKSMLSQLKTELPYMKVLGSFKA